MKKLLLLLCLAFLLVGCNKQEFKNVNQELLIFGDVKEIISNLDFFERPEWYHETVRSQESMNLFFGKDLGHFIFSDDGSYVETSDIERTDLLYDRFEYEDGKLMRTYDYNATEIYVTRDYTYEDDSIVIAYREVDSKVDIDALKYDVITLNENGMYEKIVRLNFVENPIYEISIEYEDDLIDYIRYEYLHVDYTRDVNISYDVFPIEIVDVIDQEGVITEYITRFEYEVDDQGNWIKRDTYVNDFHVSTVSREITYR